MDVSLFAPNLYEMTKEMGLSNRDWTLNKNTDEHLDFHAGIARTRKLETEFNSSDVGIDELVVAELLLHEAKVDPSLKPFAVTAKGVSEDFGPQFECIDQITGPLDLTKKSLSELCTLLAQKQKELKQSLGKKDLRKAKRATKKELQCENPSLSNQKIEPIQKLKTVVSTLTQIQRGKVIVNSTCIKCHGGSQNLNFFNDETALKTHLKEDDRFLNKISKRLDDSAYPMPPSGTLEDGDQEAVKAYLLQFSNSKK